MTTKLQKLIIELEAEAEKHDARDYYHHFEDALGALENAEACESMFLEEQDEKEAERDHAIMVSQHTQTACDLGVKIGSF